MHNPTLAEDAETVMLALVTIEEMARAAQLQTRFREVDVRTFAVEVGEVAGGVERAALRLQAALARSRVVSFRVID